MVINDNGFDVIQISWDTSRQYISQGAVIGIIFGWIIGIIGLYIIGIVIINVCIKDQEEQVISQVKQKQISDEKSENKKQSRRRKIYDQNPTMQMITYTNADQTIQTGQKAIKAIYNNMQ